MAFKRIQGFPTSRYTGPIDLKLIVNGEAIDGQTPRDFLVAIMQYIIRENAVSKSIVPFKTTGSNYLLADKPFHPNGRPFISYETIHFRGRTLYLNTHHPRFFALRQGHGLLQAAGFHPVLTQSF